MNGIVNVTWRDRLVSRCLHKRMEMTSVRGMVCCKRNWFWKNLADAKNVVDKAVRKLGDCLTQDESRQNVKTLTGCLICNLTIPPEAKEPVACVSAGVSSSTKFATFRPAIASSFASVESIPILTGGGGEGGSGAALVTTTEPCARFRSPIEETKP